MNLPLTGATRWVGRTHGTRRHWLAAAIAVFLAGAFGAAPASAQRGWLGLQLEFEEDTGPNADARETVIVTDVADGSPAARFGVVENDILLEIDGDPASEDALYDLVRTVDPGDAVELVLLRGDERIPLIVEAGERPSGREGFRVLLRDVERIDGDRMELRIRLDSIRTTAEALNRERIDRVRVRMDSLRDELERGALDMDEFEEALERAELQRLDAVEELVGRLNILQDSIGSIEVNWDPDELDAAVRGLMIPDFDPDWDPALFIGYDAGIPFMIGRRVVAGAELVDLNDSLARYFDVDRGVLVVDVSERSPAGQAGVEPGDVIVEVSGEPVDSLAEVRERFARLTFSPFFDTDAEAPEAVTITVVRDNRRLEIELRE